MSKTTQIVIGVIIVILVIWGVASLGGKEPMPNEPVKIGVIAPLTGPIADYGEEIRKGVVAGIGSSTAQVVFEDDKCDAKEAVSAFKKLTEFQKIKFLIGPACGSPQEAIVPLLKNQEILTIVSAAASANLYAQSGNNFYNIQYSLEDESKFMAEQMLARGHKKVALVSYGNAFSQTHANSFRENFKGQIVFDEVINDDNADVAPIITKIKAAGVDAIYSPDITFFFANAVPKLKQQKVSVPVYSTYVVELPAARELVPGVTYSFPADLVGTEGAIYELSKQAAEVLAAAAVGCKGDYGCVKEALASSGKFNSSGIYQRPIILKQIKNGLPTAI